MNRILIISFAIIIFYSCNNYENKYKYEVSIGDIVNIYYSTNSCCYYCLSNEQNLKHVKLLERKTIDNGPENCAGCNYTAAFVFKAESAGIDMIELKLLEATIDCDNNDITPEKHIIVIK